MAGVLTTFQRERYGFGSSLRLSYATCEGLPKRENGYETRGSPKGILYQRMWGACTRNQTVFKGPSEGWKQVLVLRI